MPILTKKPYRVMAPRTADSASPRQKRYHLEVWLPAQNGEISRPCSNGEAFQARRMEAGRKPELVHTLSGSAACVASARRRDGELPARRRLHQIPRRARSELRKVSVRSAASRHFDVLILPVWPSEWARPLRLAVRLLAYRDLLHAPVVMYT